MNLRLLASAAVLAACLVPAAASAGELKLDLEELETSAATAREIIAGCRAELPPCTDDASRRELALAFLIEALHSWVAEGQYDGVSIANARQLDPELTARWEARFPVGSEPAEDWVKGLVPPPAEPASSVAAVEYVPARPPVARREPLTLRLAFATRPVPCSTYTLESPDGDGRVLRDCPMDLGGALGADIRTPEGILVRFGIAGSRWWSEDSHFLHLQIDTLDPLAMSGYRLGARAGLGGAIPTGPAELRASAGVAVRVVGLRMADVEALYTQYGYAPPYLAATSASAWLALEWEAAIEQIRLQPQIHVEVGNEVGWNWRIAEPELNLFTRNLDADVEVRVAPGFGLAVPTSAPVALRVDLTAGVDIEQYSTAAAEKGAADQPRYADSYTTDPRAQFFFHVAVGVEARLGPSPAREVEPDPEPPAPPDAI